MGKKAKKSKRLSKKEKAIAELEKQRRKAALINRNLEPGRWMDRRLCGRDDDLYPCCQVVTQEGYLCDRQAMTTKLFIESAGCCLLCWQHAKIYGVYAFLKLSKIAYEKGMTLEEYYDSPLNAPEMYKIIETGTCL